MTSLKYIGFMDAVAEDLPYKPDTPEGSHKYAQLFYRDYLYESALNTLEVYPEASRYFLQKLQAGQVSIPHQLNALKALVAIGSRIKDLNFSTSFSPLKDEFLATLDYMDENLEELMNIEYLEPNSEDEHLYDAFGYGEFCFLREMSFIAHERARFAGIKKMIEHLKTFPEITDLCGNCYLMVKNMKPFNEDISGKIQDSTLDSYFVGSIHQQNGENTWAYVLNNIMPNNHFIYSYAGYEAIIPFLKKWLEADVTLYHELDD